MGIRIFTKTWGKAYSCCSAPTCDQITTLKKKYQGPVSKVSQTAQKSPISQQWFRLLSSFSVYSVETGSIFPFYWMNSATSMGREQKSLKEPVAGKVLLFSVCCTTAPSSCQTKNYQTLMPLSRFDPYITSKMSNYTYLKKPKPKTKPNLQFPCLVLNYIDPLCYAFWVNTWECALGKLRIQPRFFLLSKKGRLKLTTVSAKCGM